ncbi:MAG TPA: SAM-dependent chlorinase/fluorinase [Anseongella sp.]|nr:SAM-dependent chlorinase/fluorinase [Anseongella sp.]
MAIITLTTDLGHKDFYQSAIKGAILSHLPDVNIVDISHQIAPFNVAQAAYVIRNAYRFFPPGTIHIIGVDAHYQSRPRYLALLHEAHYFIGPDNGIFSLLFDHTPERIVELGIRPDPAFLHFPLLDIFVKAAGHLAAGGALGDLGNAVNDVNQRAFLQPVHEPGLIRGSVIYIDSFQNVVTNITRRLFREVRNERPFELYFSRNESITEISNYYNEVPEGEKLCLFGISGYLEIAINKGNASGLLGLDIGDIVIIQFEEAY